MNGSLLRRFRLERELTTLAVARAVGITERALAKIEKGEVTPGGDTWAKLADFFEVKMDDLRVPRADGDGESPRQVVARLTDAALKAQTAASSVERQAALAEMKRLYAVLERAEVERVDSARLSEASSKKPRVKKR